MGLIKDFCRRKQLDAEGAKLVEAQFDALTIKHIKQDDDKKSSRKLDAAAVKLSNTVGATYQALSLGIYGKARLLKSIQNTLSNRGLSEQDSEAVMSRLII